MDNKRAAWVQLYFSAPPYYLNDLIYTDAPITQKIGAIIETTKSIDSLFTTLLREGETIEGVFPELILLNKKIILEAKHAALTIKNVTTHPRFIHTYIAHVFDVTLKIMLDNYSSEQYALVSEKLENSPMNRLWGIVEFIKNVMPFSVANHNDELIDSDMDYLFTTLYSFLINIKKHAGIDDGVPKATYECIWDLSNFMSSELAMLQKFKITKSMLTKYIPPTKKDHH